MGGAFLGRPGAALLVVNGEARLPAAWRTEETPLRLLCQSASIPCGIRITDFDTFVAVHEIEWPIKSGRLQPFSEVERAEWFDLEAARSKILSGPDPAHRST